MEEEEEGEEEAAGTTAAPAATIGRDTLPPPRLPLPPPGVRLVVVAPLLIDVQTHLKGEGVVAAAVAAAAVAAAAVAAAAVGVMQAGQALAGALLRPNQHHLLPPVLRLLQEECRGVGDALMTRTLRPSSRG